MENKILREKINQRLAAFFDKKIKEVKKLSPFLHRSINQQKDFVMNGGKRLRPMLLYHGYLAGGGKNKKAILDASICIELIHAYLLIHDDIIDKDSLRRGKPTLHVNLGVPLAIVAGDMLCAYGYEILGNSSFSDKNKMQAINTLTTMLNDVILGQELDILYSKKIEITERDILKVSEHKTAKYSIEGPLHLGAILAGADKKVTGVLGRYATGLGIAFQIQDDILGMFGTEKEVGKPIGSDIKQNKQNLLIFRAKQNATSSQKKILNQLLGKESITKADIEIVKTIIIETKSLQYSKTMAEKLVGQSKSIIEKSHLPKEVKSFLLELADYVIMRNV